MSYTLALVCTVQYQPGSTLPIGYEVGASREEDFESPEKEAFSAPLILQRLTVCQLATVDNLASSAVDAFGFTLNPQAFPWIVAEKPSKSRRYAEGQFPFMGPEEAFKRDY